MRATRGRAAAALATVVLLAGGLGGCGGARWPAWAPWAEPRVLVVRDQGQVGDCRLLRELEVIAELGGFAWDDDLLAGNRRRLQRQTAALGGDTLLIVEEKGSLQPRTVGNAYRCQPEE